jgi:hypothetical protein
LNITSKSMLDALVAGLLDNSTNGVNGTFQSVTYQVPFLGFDSAVVSTLANAVQVSDGLCGAPQSSYPPPPPASSGLWGDFVNAVSSIVTTVAGAIVSLVSIVYTAVVAAANFVAHLAREAADIGGMLLARAAAALVSAGDFLATALEKFLSFIIAAITSMLDAAIQPFLAACYQYAVTLDNAVDPSLGQIVISALGGMVLELGFDIAIVLEIAILIAFVATLGWGVLADVLIGLIIGAALTVVMGFISDLTSISGALINETETWAGGFCGQSDMSGEWQSWGNAISYWEAGPSNEYAATVLSVSPEVTPPLALGAAWAFAGVSLCMELYAQSAAESSAKIASVSATVAAGISFVFGVTAKPFVAKYPPLYMMDNVVMVADGVCFGYDAVQLAEGK